MSRTRLNEVVLQGVPDHLQGVDGATVQVTPRNGGSSTLYQDETGSATWPNPLTTRDGRIEPVAGPGEVWLDTGSYNLAVSYGAGQGSMSFEAVTGDEILDVIHSSAAEDPVNTDKLYISDSGWNPATDPIEGLTTPTVSLEVVGGKYDDDGGGGIFYHWNIMGYQVNTGTAPLTPVMGRARGWTVYPLSSSGRVYGKDPTIHGVEVTTGIFASVATATVTNGSDLLTNIVPVEDGSRFEPTMPIAGTGIPVGATILAVTGRPGAPTQIQLSAPAISAGTGVTITAQPTGAMESVAYLATGNGGTVDGGGNPNGIAFQVQAYNDNSRFKKGVQFGASALQPDGTGIRFATVGAARGISFESSTFTDAHIYITSGGGSGSGMHFVSAELDYGIRFSPDSVFGIGAIYLPGNNIVTDSATGMKFATNSTQKIGFYGKTPVVRPAVDAVATDPATTQSLANSLRTALVNLGLVA